MCFLIHIQVVSYGYTAHSNKVQKEGEVPTVRLNYDILPIVVQFSEKKQAFYHFITQLCAIVGGVFTVAGMLDSCLFRLGKLSGSP